MSPRVVALAGLASLAVAMGIGRFAFTPLLPMMLSDGVVDLAGASWLASANYLGYLVGALLCTFQPWIWRALGNPPPPRPTTLVKTGLAATALLTFGMALPWASAWPWLRFASGVASAVVFVFTSGWCLATLAALQVPAMGALIYVGPGAGITLSGLVASAMVGSGWTSASGWLLFGGLAVVLSALIWQPLRPLPAASAAATASPAAAAATETASAAQVGLLVLAYGCAGFGYIITATFLPVIARAALPPSIWLDLFWPLFGCGVMLGALIASRLGGVRDLRLALLVCYLLQAAGVLASLLSPTRAGFALGSLLLGLPFTAITFYAMQEVRRLRPLHAASFMGLATAAYGLGQIVGPPLASALVARADDAAAGFDRALLVAAVTLLLGAALYVWQVRRYPLASR